ncbi:FAD/NAD(P)-binding domain-containing protein [Decorospora gaudefroyi]|uniref:FAD/NAD(P)-binding domain-containing protein n=1 Tax=Decorospora gaudefroyi TaxID=184978 RepID=A0A6A5KL08_9PLEO|nr:FAD/NAD(P)-binding domain-containing protein [Decorospora gaudefroyi]
MASANSKSVLIVGAGPAGLVAAKIFKQYGYDVTVYEAADRVGGMWRAKQGEPGDKCGPELRTNLSMFTVAFPDLSWSKVDLSSSTDFASTRPPMFPKAWQVGRYLETYANNFGITPHVSLRRRVVRACLDHDYTWKVVSDNGSGQVDSRSFDRLIIASGFYNKPAGSFDPSPSKRLLNIQHSSHFRDLSGLTITPGKVVVIGGGISGSEAAATAALQISNAKHSPNGTKYAHAGSRVYHIVNRPFYCLPRYLPQDPKTVDGRFNFAPKFLPLDLVLYNLSRRGGGELSATITTLPPEKARKGHEFMRTVLGGDQADVGHGGLVYRANQTNHPAYTGITDTYMEFVRSGIVVPVQGWVKKVKQQTNGDLFDIDVKQYEPWYHAPHKEATGSSTLTDVVGIIEATGYKTDLDWLEPSVKDLLHDENATSNPRVPYLLTRGSILAPRIPTIGFVGFYEGPYWGFMEMQARFIAETWAKHEPVAPGLLPQRDIYQNHVTKRMQEEMNEKSLQIPQFWMSDYLGLMEELAREVGVTRDNSVLGDQTGPVFPSRYQGEDTSLQAKEVVNEVAEIIRASSEDARFVAAAVFTGMQGIWNITRKIQSRTDAPGGTFSGTAHFHPREPTDRYIYSAEYLYIEEGAFTMDSGLSFPATRRYVYRYNEMADKITAWFAQDDNKSTGALFNTWEFEAPGDEEHGWVAKGHHWCDPDTYKNICAFRFHGARLDGFTIKYEVEGPNKDYSHESWYERPMPGTERDNRA